MPGNPNKKLCRTPGCRSWAMRILILLERFPPEELPATQSIIWKHAISLDPIHRLLLLKKINGKLPEKQVLEKQLTEPGGRFPE